MTASERAPDPATAEHALHGLVAAAAALVSDHGIVSIVTELMTSCVGSVGATAAGIVLASPAAGELEFLAATDHRAEHLELYQVQTASGPAADCIRTAQPVSIPDLTGVRATWPSLAEPFERAGFRGIHASPMVWQHQSIGALNLFFAADRRPDAAEVAQAFADIATAAVLHARRLSPLEITTQARAALDDRAVIERAKGVLAHTHGLTMAEAFDRMLRLSREEGRPVTAVANDVVARAVRTAHDRP